MSNQNLKIAEQLPVHVTRPNTFTVPIANTIEYLLYSQDIWFHTKTLERLASFFLAQYPNICIDNKKPKPPVCLVTLLSRSCFPLVFASVFGME